MTIVQLVNFLHDCGLDVIILGALNSLLNALLKKIFKKFGKEQTEKLPTALLFLTGAILYALWFPVASPAEFSENITLIAERGLGVGAVSALYRVLAEKTANKAGIAENRNTGEIECENKQTDADGTETKAPKKENEETDKTSGKENTPALEQKTSAAPKKRSDNANHNHQ